MGCGVVRGGMWCGEGKGGWKGKEGERQKVSKIYINVTHTIKNVSFFNLNYFIGLTCD